MRTNIRVQQGLLRLGLGLRLLLGLRFRLGLGLGLALGSVQFDWLVVLAWLGCVAMLRNNKWFPTSNFDYWTSGSRRLILLTARRVPDVMFFFSYMLGSGHLTLLIARRVPDVQTQPILCYIFNVCKSCVMPHLKVHFLYAACGPEE